MSSLSLVCDLNFSPDWCQAAVAEASLLAKSEPIDVAIYSPPSVETITLVFAWFALYGGAVPLGDESLAQDYAWVEKN